MNNIYFIMALVVASTMTVGFAYAFEYEEPFPTQKQGCVVVTDDEDRKRWECYGEWVSDNHLEDGEEKTPAEDGCPSGLDVDIRTGECKPHQQIKDEAIAECEANPECPRGNYQPKPDEDPRMPKGNEPSTTDKELIKKINTLLANPAQCYQGIGTTAGIQKIRSFEIPVIEVNGRMVLDTSVPANSVDLKGYLGQIIKHARECFAEQTLLNPQGGVLSSASAIKGYCDALPTTSSKYHPMCGYSVNHHSTIADDVPKWSQARVNQEANFEIEHDTYDIVEDVCNGFYTQEWKMTFKECREIESAKVEKSGGKIPSMEIQNDIEDRYNQYRADGGAKMAQELAEKAIQDRISELFKQIKALEGQK